MKRPATRQVSKRHVSAEMIEAGQQALLAVARTGIGPDLRLNPFKLAGALAAAFRAMAQAGAGRDPTAAERQRRHRARKALLNRKNRKNRNSRRS